MRTATSVFGQLWWHQTNLNHLARGFHATATQHTDQVCTLDRAQDGMYEADILLNQVWCVIV